MVMAMSRIRSAACGLPPAKVRHGRFVDAIQSARGKILKRVVREGDTIRALAHDRRYGVA